MSATYLPEGLPIPVPESDGLSRPYWEGLKREELWVQRCSQCQSWQWGPEWICHHCLSFEVGWARVEGKGRIYSWERVWHPVHPALRQRRDPYIAVLVELPQADHIRMLGNLLGDPQQTVTIGAPVDVVFEHHADVEPAFSLAHWRLV
jgi:uncharacterized OB-fold protein